MGLEGFSWPIIWKDRAIISEGFQGFGIWFGFFFFFPRIKKNSGHENSLSNKMCLLQNAIEYHTFTHISCVSVNVITSKSESR